MRNGSARLDDPKRAEVEEDAASSLVQRADARQRRMPALAFPLAVIKKYGEDRAGQLAAMVAFYGFFSLVPLLLVLLTATGILLHDDPDRASRIVAGALTQFPVVGEQIQQNLAALPGKGFVLILSIAGAVWSGLGGIKAMQSAMDRIWSVPMKDQPGFLRALLRAVLMLGGLGVFVLLASLLGGITAGTGGVAVWLRVAGFVAAALLNLAIFLVALRVLTVAEASWVDVLPGALFAAAGWTVLQALGGFVVGRQIEKLGETYGLFALVIALLTWIYLGAQITLWASEVNVVHARSLWPRALDPRSMTEEDKRTLTLHAKVEERRPEEEVAVEFEGHV